MLARMTPTVRRRGATTGRVVSPPLPPSLSNLTSIGPPSLARLLSSAAEIKKNSQSYIDVPSVSVDAKGDSVFGSLRIPLDQPKGGIGLLSKLISGTGVMFRLTPGTYNFDWHLAPRRQFIVNLDAAVKVTVSNGESKVLEKGDVFFVEDVSGKGHFSQAVDAKPRHSLFIPVDDVSLRTLGAQAINSNGFPAQGTTAMALDSVDRPKAYVFDLYGTLLDFNAVDAGKELFGENDWHALSQTWRTKQLQYSWLRELARGQDAFVEFKQITMDSLEYALEAHNQSLTETEKQRLFKDYSEMKAFPEVEDVLNQIKDEGSKSVALSNGTRGMIVAALKANGLLHLLEDLITIDDTKCYKVDPKMYQSCVDTLQIPCEHMAFVSANCWDACAAARFGFAFPFWINRGNLPADRLPGSDRLKQGKCLKDIL